MIEANLINPFLLTVIDKSMTFFICLAIFYISDPWGAEHIIECVFVNYWVDLNKFYDSETGGVRVLHRSQCEKGPTSCYLWWNKIASMNGSNHFLSVARFSLTVAWVACLAGRGAFSTHFKAFSSWCSRIWRLWRIGCEMCLPEGVIYFTTFVLAAGGADNHVAYMVIRKYWRNRGEIWV